MNMRRSLSDRSLSDGGSLLCAVGTAIVNAELALFSTARDVVAGDAGVLDNAIRKDFSAFDNIDLRYTINSIASGKGGIYVSISYNRALISSRDGRPYRDSGITEFVFRAAGDTVKVFSMKNPLIFGLSDAANVSTGTVRTVSNDPVIIVDGATVVPPGNATVSDGMGGRSGVIIVH